MYLPSIVRKNFRPLAMRWWAVASVLAEATKASAVANPRIREAAPETSECPVSGTARSHRQYLRTLRKTGKYWQMAGDEPSRATNRDKPRNVDI